MNNQLQQHVFISYVRENQEQIDRLCQDLERHGVEVWLDRNNITPGIFWEDAIRKAIQDGSFFVACFSVEYKKRTSTHMNEELNLAIEVLRKRPRDRAWFIPVVLSGDVPDWEIFPGKTLQSIQWVALYEDWEAGIQKILSVIKPIPNEVQNLISALRKYHDEDLAVDAFRIRRDGLSPFMEAYLTHRGKSDLFTDSEFHDACRRLTDMVGERDLTLLLAKLYAEQLIAVKEGTTDEKLPDNIPDLMLSYLNELNRNVPKEDRLENPTIHRYAKVLAWESLKETFRPSFIRTDDAFAALTVEHPQDQLDYLETRLRLIKIEQPAEDRYTFLLDPLAEYLAGLHLFDLFGEKDDAWSNFIAEADLKEGAPETIKGFLLAVRDCIIAKRQEANIPDFVSEELAKRAGLDVEAIKQAKRKQRIQRLINQLNFPETYDRRQAAEALGKIGSETVPDLIKALKDPEAEVRWSAARAIGEIGPEAKTAVPALIGALKDQDEAFRRSAAHALGEIGPKAVPALSEALKDPEAEVRRRAAEALGEIGPETNATVPALIGALKDQDKGVRQKATYALWQIGPNVVPALIEALKEPETYARRRAAWTLGQMGSKANAAVPALSKALKDKSEGVRRDAAGALGNIGPAAMPALVAALEDPDEIIRLHAAEALEKINTPEAQKALEEYKRKSK